MGGAVGAGSQSGASGTMPGSGGVSRGRGDAPLVYGDKSPVSTAGLQAKKLPRGAVVPRDWKLAGIARTAPEVEPERASGEGAAGAAGTGAAVSPVRLRPQHREVVRKFFDR